MILRRALFQEASLTSMAVMLILLVLFVFMGLTKLLAKAAVGEQAPDVIFILLLLELLRKIDLLLPLAIFIGILMTLSRWYRDNEMTVLAACGVGITSLLRPVMLLAFLAATVVALFSLYFSPLTVGMLERIKIVSAERHEVRGIAPGTFMEFNHGARIFYVEDVDKDKISMNRIFSSAEADNKRDIITAITGYDYTDTSSGDKYLLLKNGVRYLGRPGGADFNILKFESYALRIQPAGNEGMEISREGTSSLALLSAKDRHLRAELHWRLAKPLSVFVLAAFAMVLAYTDIRRGRVVNLFMAVLVYFIYTNLLGIGNTLLKMGQLPMVFGLWWIHAGLALVVVYFLIRRNQNRPLLVFPWAWKRR